jgi:DNA-directed RNA polymerase delta subunit
MARRPQTARVIADALRNGGQVHATDVKAAYVNVSTALRRSNDFVQTRNKEWALAEWYGNKSSKSDSE